jgi:hypothetical protein
VRTISNEVLKVPQLRRGQVRALNEATRRAHRDALDRPAIRADERAELLDGWKRADDLRAPQPQRLC